MTNNPTETIINGPTVPHSTRKELCMGSTLASSSGKALSFSITS